MSDDVTAALGRLSRVISSTINAEAAVAKTAPPDVVKQLVIARIAALRELRLLSEEEATLLVGSLDSSKAHIAPPAVVKPDGEPSLCGVVYSLMHRQGAVSSSGSRDDITISVPDSVAGAVAGALVGGGLYGATGAIVGAGIGSVLAR